MIKTAGRLLRVLATSVAAEPLQMNDPSYHSLDSLTSVCANIDRFVKI